MANNSVLFTNRLVNDNLDKAVDQFFTLVESQYFQEIENFKKYGQLHEPLEAEQKQSWWCAEEIVIESSGDNCPDKELIDLQVFVNWVVVSHF